MNKKPVTKREIIHFFKKQKKIIKKTELLDIKNCKDRILAQDLISTINLPPFNNSAVDGYAILSSEINNKSFLIGDNRIAAGDNKNIKIKKGQAIRIFTGAKMPINSSTVIMQENINVFNNKIIVKKKPSKGQNTRLKGEDIKKNKKILKKGTRIDTNYINLIAAIGFRKIKVFKKIKIGFFTSGDELRKPIKHLKGSEINNSNYYSLNSLLNLNLINSQYCGNLRDNFKYVEKKIKKTSARFDLIVTAGGASVGDEDHLIKVINKIGKIFFWKAAIKPGRPIAFGKVNKCFILCLPGNPVSVQLLYALLVKPFIFYLSGSDILLPKAEKIKVNFKMQKKTNRMEWLRVIKKKKNFDFVAEKYNKQGSGMISSMAYSDGIIEIPEEVKKIEYGQIYDYYDFKILFP
tara:strand:+ start:4564 stop:5781 length:1218 start_codon:yes stop_codon:yes gene_type:complete